MTRTAPAHLVREVLVERLHQVAEWHRQRAQELVEPPPLSDGAAELAEWIKAHPGCTGQQLADACSLSHDHVRRLAAGPLRRAGYRNARGYQPPPPGVAVSGEALAEASAHRAMAEACAAAARFILAPAPAAAGGG